MSYADSSSPVTAKESFSYTYDKNGNALSERHINSYPTTKIDETRTYQYDSLGRLTKSVKTNNLSKKSSTTTYGFDAVGNMRLENVDGINTYSYYNGLNQLTSKEGGNPSSASHYSYDANGNQITEKVGNNAVTTFAYDVENQLMSVTKQDKLIQTNLYNSAGQRIKKKDAGIEEINYFYQGDVALYTKDSKGNKTTFNLLGGSDNVIMSKRYKDKYAGKYYSYSKDARTSTSNVIDDNGNYVTSYDYSNYGETTKLGDNTFMNEICYTGGIYDESTKLYYLNARYFDPVDARFMTQDTYRGENNDSTSWNLYTYCSSNPVNYIDPSGHWTITIHKKIAKWVFKSFKKRLKIKGFRKGKIKKNLKKGSVWPDKKKKLNKKTKKNQEYHGFAGFVSLRANFRDNAKKYFNDGKYAKAFKAIGKGLHTTQDYYAHHVEYGGKMVTKSQLPITPINMQIQYDLYADNYHWDFVGDQWKYWSNQNDNSRYQNAKIQSIVYFGDFMSKIGK